MKMFLILLCENNKKKTRRVLEIYIKKLCFVGQKKKKENRK